MSVAEMQVEAAGSSKADLVYQSLRRRILDGTYSPGHRLVLGRLATEFKVSAVPVREAVRKLEAEGLIDFERNVGATVAGIDLDAYHDAIETVAILEGAATALSAPQLTKRDLQKARSINTNLRRAIESFEPNRITGLNDEFHKLVCGKCPNHYLLGEVTRGWAHLAAVRRSTFSLIPGRPQRSVEEHAHILELISDSAPEREIELAAREHKLRTMRALAEAASL